MGDGKTYNKHYGWVTKPDSRLDRAPVSIAPFNWFVDWSLWFVPLQGLNYHPWLFRLLYKLLKHEKAVEEMVVVPEGSEKVTSFRIESWRYTFDYAPDNDNWW